MRVLKGINTCVCWKELIYVYVCWKGLIHVRVLEGINTCVCVGRT